MAAIVLVTLAAAMVPGCSQLVGPDVAGRLDRVTEPDLGGEYLLYRPAAYDRDKSWPLIVVCHSRPFDSPAGRIRAYAPLAEEYGFIVLAPELEANRSVLAQKAGQRADLLRRDEKHILASVRHARGGATVSADRLFICGHAGGAAPALFAGLRNPDVFRAAAAVQPKFDPAELAPARRQLDAYQPVLVQYAISDAVTGRRGRDCADWLRQELAELTEDHASSARSGTEKRVVEFFEYVVAQVPWVRIDAQAEPGGDPLAVKLSVRGSLAPRTYLWEFGDGETSPVASPGHTYAQPGSYVVSVSLTPAQGRPLQRRKLVTVPLPAGS